MFIRPPKRLDDWFRTNRSVALKILGAASVGGFFGVFAVIRLEHRGQPVPSNFPAGVIGGFTAIGALIGLGLSLRDVVAERLADDRPVHPLLRLLFAMEATSAVIWLAIASAAIIIVLVMFPS